MLGVLDSAVGKAICRDTPSYAPHRTIKPGVRCTVELDRENVGWSVGSEVVESKSAVLVLFSLLT